MGFVMAREHHAEYGETASLLLQMAEELGYDVQTVRTVAGGFSVPDEISDALKPVPPESWSEPLPVVDVEYGEDGTVYLTTEAFIKSLDEPVDETRTASLTEIREWAKTAGFTVADKGRISATIVEAYYAAKAE